MKQQAARAELVERVLVLLTLAACAHAPLAPPSSAGQSAWRQYLQSGDSSVFDHSGDPLSLYGRGFVAFNAGDDETAWQSFLAVVRGGAERQEGFTALVAALAAAKLGAMVGDLPDPKDLRALYDLDVESLPYEAARQLLRAQAHAARRLRHRPQLAALDARLGCATGWFVSPVYGRLSHLDLDRKFAPEGAQPGPLVEQSTHGCQLRIDPADASGVRYATQWISLTRRTEVAIFVESELDWRLYVDGHASFANDDRAHHPPRLRKVLVELGAGWHRLQFKISETGSRLDLTVSVLDAHRVQPVEFFAGSIAAAPGFRSRTVRAEVAPVFPIAKPREESADLLALEAALFVGDSDGGAAALQTLLERAPKFSPAFFLQGELRKSDPSLPPSTALDEARQAFAQALQLQPKLLRARLELAAAQLQPSRLRESTELLEEMPPPPRPRWQLFYTRFLVFQARGFEVEADGALLQALKFGGESCTPATARLNQLRHRHQIDAALALIDRVPNCFEYGSDRAELLRARGDVELGVAELTRLVGEERRPEWIERLSELLVEAKRPLEALPLRKELVQRFSRRVRYRLLLSDLLIALGDSAQAKRTLEVGAEQNPESRELLQALRVFCRQKTGCAPIDRFRIDGKQVIADFERQGKLGRPAYQSPAVLLLDRTVVVVHKSGARSTLTHNIVQVLGKDGIDKWAEVEIPEGAEVLTLRTIKADGSVREPETITEKSTVSLSDLDVGDYVEFEYVESAAAPAAFPGGFISERFYFQSFDAPLDRTEMLVITPPKMALQVDARAGAPTPLVEHLADFDSTTFARRYVAQVAVEPASPPLGEFTPSVRVGAGLSLTAWRDFLRDGHYFAERRSAALDRLAHAIAGEQKGDEKKLRALDLWVRAHVQNGGSLDEPATFVLADHEGSRVNLLAAMARAVGIPVEIWLGRDEDEAVDKDVELEAFHIPVLLGAGLTIDPRFRHADAGFLAPPLRQSLALALSDGALKLRPLPSAADDRREMSIQIDLEPSGQAVLRVREELRGWPALQWREALDKLPGDRLRPQFETHTLSYYFRSPVLDDLKWSYADDDGVPFVVEYQFRAAAADLVPSGLLLPAPFPARLGSHYVGVAKRTHSLVLDYVAPTHVHTTVKLPNGAGVTPAPTVELSGFGKFHQSVRASKNTIEIESRLEMARQRVAPDRYPDFVRFATELDHAEQRAALIGLDFVP